MAKCSIASDLNQRFGIAFYPLGPNPEWVYIANSDGVVRYRYKSGDLAATGQPEKIVFSPGDLDETIQAFIDYNKARGVAANLDVTFLRVNTFRDGFLQGFSSCSKWQDSSTTLNTPSG